MRPAHEANVTMAPSAIGAPDQELSRAWGKRTQAGDAQIINEPGRPATIVIPTEQVRLMVVELPLASAAKRLAALPFAIEDRIAEPLQNVHMALGAEVAPKRYLAAVISHAVMQDWVARYADTAEAEAALLPDVVMLPVPETGSWAVLVAGARALVRQDDGAGFAVPIALLSGAWIQAGKPEVHSYGDALPDGIPFHPATLRSMLPQAPLVDLRQGIYARRAEGNGFWRKLGWIAAIGLTAHILIALADSYALRGIADRREEQTRALVQRMAPGVTLENDFVEQVAGMLPVAGAARGDAFLPALTKLSQALTPLAGTIQVQTVQFDQALLIMELAGDGAVESQVKAALASGSVRGNVARDAGGGVRIEVPLQ